MSPKDTKVFNTRLSDDQIEKIRALAYFKRVNIQDVVSGALDEFFKKRSGDVDAAVEAYRKKDNPL